MGAGRIDEFGHVAKVRTVVGEETVEPRAGEAEVSAPLAADAPGIVNLHKGIDTDPHPQTSSLRQGGQDYGVGRRRFQAIPTPTRPPSGTPPPTT